MTVEMRSKVHPSHKTQYRVTNWPEYERIASITPRIKVSPTTEPLAPALQIGSANGTSFASFTIAN